jgi:predicted enzyme related to lactoylglutathione lyase
MPNNVPVLFRVILQVSDLDQAADFYSKLLGTDGRRISRATRHYFDCGPVILALVDPKEHSGEQKPNADNIYFAVPDLEEVHTRARKLGCLSKGVVHEENAGEIVTRPWGERSFYVEDPWQNSLCFVDEKTVFMGR